MGGSISDAKFVFRYIEQLKTKLESVAGDLPPDVLDSLLETLAEFRSECTEHYE